MSPTLTLSAATVTTTLSPVPAAHSRKRTMSFSSPQPHKCARTLRRTASYLSLDEINSAVETTLYGRSGPSSYWKPDCSAGLPYTRSMRYYKEERQRRKAAVRSATAAAQIPPAPLPLSFTITSRVSMPRPRTSSPLSPKPCALPARAGFPRSKPEPDLYRVAITTRMRMSPEGRKILYMGPRLALSMLTASRELDRSLYSATHELERIVASQKEADDDIVMTENDGSLSKSWVVVPTEDWEMVDCRA